MGLQLRGGDFDVLAARVSPEGKVLDKSPIALGAGAGNQVLADVASDGKGFLGVWQGFVGDGFCASAPPAPRAGPSTSGPGRSRRSPGAERTTSWSQPTSISTRPGWAPTGRPRARARG